jgi:hypothetical protein
MAGLVVEEVLTQVQVVAVVEATQVVPAHIIPMVVAVVHFRLE